MFDSRETKMPKPEPRWRNIIFLDSEHPEVDIKLPTLYGADLQYNKLINFIGKFFILNRRFVIDHRRLVIEYYPSIGISMLPFAIFIDDPKEKYDKLKNQGLPREEIVPILEQIPSIRITAKELRDDEKIYLCIINANGEVTFKKREQPEAFFSTLSTCPQIVDGLEYLFQEGRIVPVPTEKSPSGFSYIKNHFQAKLGSGEFFEPTYSQMTAFLLTGNYDADALTTLQDFAIEK